VVECDLAKVEVAGSNPVSRSNFLAVEPASAGFFYPAGPLEAAPSPSGKAEVCTTSIPGSTPGGASKFTVRIRSSVRQPHKQARVNWTTVDYESAFRGAIH
jgi:hypothetical protein